MALNEHLETLIGSLKSPEQQQQLRSILEAEPQIGEGWQRQSDYSRNMDALRRQREEHEAAMADERQKVAQWKAFHDSEAAREEQYRSELEARRLEIEQLRSKMAEPRGDEDERYRGGEGGESVMDAVNNALASRGFVSKQDVQASIQAAAAEFQKRYEAQRAADMRFTGALSDQCRRYEREFNKPLASEELLKFMADKSLFDPAVAVDQYAAKDREDAMIAKLRKEIQEEERAKASAARLPGSNAMPDSQLSARQRLEMGRVATQMPTGSKLGSGRLADAIAERRAREGAPPLGQA